MVEKELIELSLDLLKIKTDSPCLCMPALHLISNFLKKIGFFCDFVKSKEGHNNLICRIESKKGPHICFAGHVDVVPAGNLELWKFNPFEPTILDQLIFARGAADMKCAIACFLIALKTFIKKNSFNGSFSVVITSDEETLSNGAHAVVEQISNKKIDLILIGEPTANSSVGDNITKFRHGSANFFIKIIGKQSHVAFSDLDDNPNTTITKILNDILLTDWGDEELPTKMEITLLNSQDLAPNIIPNEAFARINFRFSYKQSIEKIITLVSESCKKFSQKGKYEIKYDNTAQPCKYKTSNLEKHIISAANSIGKTTAKLSGCLSVSDGYIFNQIAPVIEIGALKNQAHKINENIAISDLQKLYLIYLRSIEDIYIK